MAARLRLEPLGHGPHVTLEGIEPGDDHVRHLLQFPKPGPGLFAPLFLFLPAVENPGDEAFPFAAEQQLENFLVDGMQLVVGRFDGLVAGQAGELAAVAVVPLAEDAIGVFHRHLVLVHGLAVDEGPGAVDPAKVGALGGTQTIENLTGIHACFLL